MDQRKIRQGRKEVDPQAPEKIGDEVYVRDFEVKQIRPIGALKFSATGTVYFGERTRVFARNYGATKEEAVSQAHRAIEAWMTSLRRLEP